MTTHDTAINGGWGTSHVESATDARHVPGGQQGAIPISARRSPDPTGDAPALVNALLGTSPDCINLLDRQGRVGFVNANGLRAMGAERFEAVDGRPWTESWPPESRERVAKSVRLAAEGRSDRFEALGHPRAGAPSWWDVTVSPLPASLDGPGRIISISRDVTDRVQRERVSHAHEKELRRLNRDQARTLEDRDQTVREKTLLMREVDHRVKNSLAMINSLLRMQARTVEDGGAREALARASMRVQAIAAVHDRLYRRVTESEIDLADYLDALCGDLRASMDGTHIELETRLGDLGNASGETTLGLGLIITELVTNAVRHARSDGGPCTITLRSEARRDGRHAIVVEDDGCGLPKGFEPSSSKGLGMRVVLSSIQRIDGELHHERPEGGGTRFRVLF